MRCGCRYPAPSRSLSSRRALRRSLSRQRLYAWQSVRRQCLHGRERRYRRPVRGCRKRERGLCAPLRCGRPAADHRRMVRWIRRARRGGERLRKLCDRALGAGRIRPGHFRYRLQPRRERRRARVSRERCNFRRAVLRRSGDEPERTVRRELVAARRLRGRRLRLFRQALPGKRGRCRPGDAGAHDAGQLGRDGGRDRRAGELRRDLERTGQFHRQQLGRVRPPLQLDRLGAWAGIPCQQLHHRTAGELMDRHERDRKLRRRLDELRPDREQQLERVRAALQRLGRHARRRNPGERRIELLSADRERGSGLQRQLRHRLARRQPRGRSVDASLRSREKLYRGRCARWSSLCRKHGERQEQRGIQHRNGSGRQYHDRLAAVRPGRAGERRLRAPVPAGRRQHAGSSEPGAAERPRGRRGELAVLQVHRAARPCHRGLFDLRHRGRRGFVRAPGRASDLEPLGRAALPQRQQ